jgi:hypothetical protein
MSGVFAAEQRKLLVICGTLCFAEQFYFDN